VDLIKRIYHFIASVFLYSVFFILVVIGICVGLYFIDQFQSNKSGVQRPPLFGAYVIISPSMEPEISVLDAVITMRKDVKKIDKEDVITFISKDSSHYGVIITHRIVGIFENDDGSISYRTKGDNNNVEDQTLVNYNDILGKVILVIPYIGHLQQLLATPAGWIAVIVVPCVLIIGSDIVKLAKGGNKKKKEEEEENDGDV